MKRKRTLRNLALVAIGIVAVLAAIPAAKLGPTARQPSPHIQHFVESELSPIDAPRLQQLLSGHRGKPTLIFIYASWCPFCKQQFPMLQALQMRYPQQALNMLFISQDRKKEELAEFLMQHYPDAPFTRYHLAPQDRPAVHGLLQELGFTPDNAVPYLLLLDAEGNKAAEFKGRTPIPQLQPAIQAVLPKEAAMPSDMLPPTQSGTNDALNAATPPTHDRNEPAHP